MNEDVMWYRKKQIERTLNNLDKGNMKGMYIENRERLMEVLDEYIQNDTTVGVGDSMTLFETGVIDYLRNRSITFLDKYVEGLTSHDKKSIYRRNFSADTFITGTNALTEGGVLFNIDGNGSRVAPMIYGPDQVIVVVGYNKLVKDLSEAEKRVRQYAAPIDAKRLHRSTPCTKVGYCVDCASKERICNDFVTITGQFVKDRIKVLIMDESLGF